MIPGMARVLITYFSRTGNTEKMAKLVAEGAREVKCSGFADALIERL